jgi:hypothetical protein
MENFMPTATNDPNSADIKAALEAFAGHPIDASARQVEQQLRVLTIPFGSYSFTPAGTPGETGDNIGQVVSRSIIFPVPPTPIFPTSCTTSELLDVSGTVNTSNTGSITFRLTSFLCPNEPGRIYSNPVNIQAAPISTTPVFLTVTFSMVVASSNTTASDIEITIFAWNANGRPASASVEVHWRCRVPTFILV